ncbi:MAG: hypothetical protein IT169_07800 [Bryobacterales bacterium]|nr:hypothetical protein [Bryobacterales bacterium]
MSTARTNNENAVRFHRIQTRDRAMRAHGAQATLPVDRTNRIEVAMD